MSGLEKKFATKSKIVNYIINRESTSKVEISKELNLSMPTVLSNVKDLSLCNGNCDHCKSSGNGAGKSEV